MKVKSVLLAVAFLIMLLGCKKDSEESYSTEDMVFENTQATLYYHAIFREAENAWAQIDDLGYPTNEIVQTSGSSYKKMIYSANETTYVISIEYNNWTSGAVRLSGSMKVTLPDVGMYHVKDKQARVELTSFAVNDQRVAGTITMTYTTDPAAGTEAQLNTYAYTVSNGIIYNLEEARQQDISVAITDGVYTQVEGASTKTDASDDVWTFTGTAKGQLYGNSELTYTNAVVKSETLNGTLYLNASCNKALQGVCTLTVNGYPNIAYSYGNSCASAIEILTIEDLD